MTGPPSSRGQTPWAESSTNTTESRSDDSKSPSRSTTESLPPEPSIAQRTFHLSPLIAAVTGSQRSLATSQTMRHSLNAVRRPPTRVPCWMRELKRSCDLRLAMSPKEAMWFIWRRRSQPCRYAAHGKVHCQSSVCRVATRLATTSSPKQHSLVAERQTPYGTSSRGCAESHSKRRMSTPAYPRPHTCMTHRQTAPELLSRPGDPSADLAEAAFEAVVPIVARTTTFARMTREPYFMGFASPRGENTRRPSRL